MADKNFTIREGVEVTETVIANLELKNDNGKYLTHNELSRMISVSVPSSTRVITISIQADDPYEAHDIADEVCSVAADHIKSVMDFEAVNVVEEADYPFKASGPIKRNYVLIGAVFGFLLSSIIILLKYLLDDTIKTEEDVTKYLGLSTLGLIPVQDLGNGPKKKSRRAKVKRRRK